MGVSTRKLFVSLGGGRWVRTLCDSATLCFLYQRVRQFWSQQRLQPVWLCECARRSICRNVRESVQSIAGLLLTNLSLLQHSDTPTKRCSVYLFSLYYFFHGSEQYGENAYPHRRLRAGTVTHTLLPRPLHPVNQRFLRAAAISRYIAPVRSLFSYCSICI